MRNFHELLRCLTPGVFLTQILLSPDSNFTYKLISHFHFSNYSAVLRQSQFLLVIACHLVALLPEKNPVFSHSCTFFVIFGAFLLLKLLLLMKKLRDFLDISVQVKLKLRVEKSKNLSSTCFNQRCFWDCCERLWSWRRKGKHVSVCRRWCTKTFQEQRGDRKGFAEAGKMSFTRFGAVWKGCYFAVLIF